MPRDRDLIMWTVYRYPTDHPDHYVVRKFKLVGGIGVATADHFKARTYKKIERLMIRRGLVRMLRSPQDEPQIVETWL